MNYTLIPIQQTVFTTVFGHPPGFVATLFFYVVMLICLALMIALMLPEKEVK